MEQWRWGLYAHSPAVPRARRRKMERYRGEHPAHQQPTLAAARRQIGSVAGYPPVVPDQRRDIDRRPETADSDVAPQAATDIGVARSPCVDVGFPPRPPRQPVRPTARSSGSGADRERGCDLSAVPALGGKPSAGGRAMGVVGGGPSRYSRLDTAPQAGTPARSYRDHRASPGVKKRPPGVARSRGRWASSGAVTGRG